MSSTTIDQDLRLLVRVLIVEDSSFEREGVHSLVKPYRDLDMVGVAANVAEAQRMMSRMAPDVIVVNLGSDHDVAHVVRDLRRHAGDARMLVLVNSTDPGVARYLRNAGADELLFGFVRPPVVIGAIRHLGMQSHASAAGAAAAD